MQSQYPLQELCNAWITRINHARETKWEQFGRYAEEAQNFYDGPHDWMWEDGYSKGPDGFLREAGEAMRPTFKMTVNKPHEAVALFGPALFAKYPQVLAEPRRRSQVNPAAFGLDINFPPHAEAWQSIQMELEFDRQVRTARAGVRKDYLNAVQLTANKKLHAHRAITEAVVKGMGILWTDVYRPSRRGDPQIAYPRSTYVSVDDLLMDADARVFEDVQCIYRYNCLPVNLAERKFGLPPETLHGHLRSSEGAAHQVRHQGKGPHAKKNMVGPNGKRTHDLIEFWEIYSKNGIGGRLSDMFRKPMPFEPEQLGDYCYLVVSPGIPFPLNVPQSVDWTTDDGLQHLVDVTRWPIPFYEDEGANGGWPFSQLAFYFSSGKPWPVSLIKPAVPWIRFLNWALSFLADRIAASSGDVLAVSKAFLKHAEEQLTGPTTPFRTIAIDDNLLQKRKVNELVQLIQAAKVTGDAWTIIDYAMREVERATGINDLLAGLGGATAIRSAAEADIRNSNTQVRPDDMAEKTEQFFTDTIRKENLAAQWLLSESDVQPVLGPHGAMVWRQMQSEPFSAIVHDYQYTIEAGSARKPNMAQRLRGLQDLGTAGLQVFAQMAATGNVGPFNTYLTQYTEALNVPVDGYLLPEPPPGPPPPSADEIEAEAAARKAEADQVERAQELNAKATGIELDTIGRQLTLEFDAVERAGEVQHELEMGAIKRMQARQALRSSKSATRGEK